MVKATLKDVIFESEKQQKLYRIELKFFKKRKCKIVRYNKKEYNFQLKELKFQLRLEYIVCFKCIKSCPKVNRGFTGKLGVTDSQEIVLSIKPPSWGSEFKATAIVSWINHLIIGH